MKWLSRLVGLALIAGSFAFLILELRVTKAVVPTSHLIGHVAVVTFGLAIMGYAQTLEDFIAKVAPFLKRGA
jgi:hypothetical protein